MHLLISAVWFFLAGCSSTPAQATSTPIPIPSPSMGVEIYKLSSVDLIAAYEHSLMAGDVERAIAYFHEDAVVSIDSIMEDGETITTAEFKSIPSIKIMLKSWIGQSETQITSVKEIHVEQDVVQYRMEAYTLDGRHGFQDAYAIMKDGKIYQLHYYPPEEVFSE
jgi:hypothetical protein